MSRDDIEKLIYELPMDQHHKARAKIRQALKLGWTAIDLDNWGGKADQKDLFGLNPKLEYLPLPDVE